MIVPTLLYGTLRVDQNGLSWGVNGQEYIRDAVITGARMWSYHDAFPVVKLDDFYTEADTVVGDIVFYDINDPEFDHVCAVESSAGYFLVETKATCPDGRVIEVVVWNWGRSPEGLKPITDGDWLSYLERSVTEPF